MLRRYPVTTVAVLVAVALVVIASLGTLDILPWNLRFLSGIEHDEVDDLISGFGLVILALAIDRIVADRREVRAAQLEAERRRIVEATMKAVLDIVRDSIRQLEPLRNGAEAGVPPESVLEFDQLLNQTSAKLKRLADPGYKNGGPV
ncbi:MAG: hypothetical protein ABI647_13505 [Gemmatimonadota bacterium]